MHMVDKKLLLVVKKMCLKNAPNPFIPTLCH